MRIGNRRDHAAGHGLGYTRGMREPLVYVVVINWNGMAHLRECFDSLVAGSYGHARFVLADNASSDESVAFVRDTYPDPRVEILECGGNLGWSRGNNLAMEGALAAGADYILLLNNDTVTAPDAVVRLVEAMEAEPALGALAPKLVLYDTPAVLNSVGLECSIIGACWDRGLGRADRPRWDAPVPVAGACGAGMMLRAEALRQVGLFPTDFDIYLDDLDLCLRLWAAGYRVATCPSAVIRHKFSATMGAGARGRHKYYLNTRNRWRLLVRNFPWRTWPQVAPRLAVGEGRAVGRALLDGEPWRAWCHVRAAVSAVPYAAGRRRSAVSKGATQDASGFWPLVQRDPLFFPGTELPRFGWYAPRTVQGRDVRPIAPRARCRVAGGRLRVFSVNCYPALGPSDISVMQSGRCLARFQTANTAEHVVETEEGPLELVAHTLFDAEATGERADFGGWVALTPSPDYEG